MISDNINNVKKFMSTLLVGDTFNDFLVNEVTITTYNTFHIDGHIKKNFYSSEEYEELGEPDLSKWGLLKPLCYEIIKGKKTPLYFKIIFALPKELINSIIDSNNIDFEINNVNGLFINIKFENGVLSYVTGTSLSVFTLDKSLEKAFDCYVSKFLEEL